jgi:hypothetical protein
MCGKQWRSILLPLTGRLPKLYYKWIYRPAVLNGNPAEVITVVPVVVPAK